MAEETRTVAENLKKLRIFKDSKVQAEYEKTLENFGKTDAESPVKLITESQSLKLKRAKELAGQYFNKAKAQDATLKND
jgi:hypothetical protein